jgi:hypothetical protein
MAHPSRHECPAAHFFLEDIYAHNMYGLKFPVVKGQGLTFKKKDKASITLFF